MRLPPGYTVATHKGQMIFPRFEKGEKLPRTHFFITSPVEACRSSRIDRIYCTLWDDELLVVRPATFIPNTSGAEALREFKRFQACGARSTAAF